MSSIHYASDVENLRAVQHEGLTKPPRKNIKRGHLWVLVGDHKYIAFKYTPNWTAQQAEAFLGTRIGWMQVDGYKGYESIANGRPLLLVGCWMHARRYFVKAFEAKDLRAAVPLNLIKQMYRVERESKDAGDDHGARYERRLRELVPLLDQLQAWLDEHRGAVPPKSNLGKAIGYLDNHWDILRVVEKDGALELDSPSKRCRALFEPSLRQACVSRGLRLGDIDYKRSTSRYARLVSYDATEPNTTGA